MAKSDILAPFIRKWEGGFVCNPDDLGGATNKGVTIATYESYCRKNGCPKPTIERLKVLSEGDWFDIFKTMYWDVCHGDNIINQNIANIFIDWYWMSGKNAIRRVQRLVGTKADGIVGPKTIAAINSHSPLPLFGLIKEARRAYYEDICQARAANKKFYRGWMNRLNDLKYED